MTLVTGDRYLESLVKFVESHAEPLIEGALVLKLNPIGLHYVYSRIEALAELESLLAGAPVDYLRAYVSDLGDHRALEQLRRILRLLTSLKVVSVLPPPARDPSPLSLLPFARLKVLELRGCDLSTSDARGLLELRHTLEKLICHNSTDALRHVFASRIADIKNSPQWNRLSFVSCACNGLLLMDESLQLLPAIETLDLSRNKFAKVDNLRRCTKLKHLDLGFNHLRSVTSFIEVSCCIIKLVLRNNTLTTLHGIENLKSLVGLDISYNIISNFSEMEILAGLSSLQNLWLEGNPICCARWYRAQVFSFFPNPHQLKLDEENPSTSDLWKRKVIVASRQKQPASFGFYIPARDGAELGGNINTKRKKVSRLVSIKNEEDRSFPLSDQDSVSCDNDTHSKEENANSDQESEIVDFMNRIEFMKKKRSDLWLQEFKDWMDHESDNFFGGIEGIGCNLNSEKSNHWKGKLSTKHQGETSRYISESGQLSGDDSSTNILESDTSFAETFTSFNTQRYSNHIGEVSSKFFVGRSDAYLIRSARSTRKDQENLKSSSNEVFFSAKARISPFDSFATAEGEKMSANSNTQPITVTNTILDSHSSLASTGSPPHYKEDILHRRHNLEEEFLQLSAESFSVASSDSDTSCSDDESIQYRQGVSQIDQSVTENLIESGVECFPSAHCSLDVCDETDFALKQNGKHTSDLYTEGNSSCIDVRGADFTSQDAEVLGFVKQEAYRLEKKKPKRKPKRRMVSLPEETNAEDEIEKTKKSNENVNNSRDDEDRTYALTDSHKASVAITSQSTMAQLLGNHKGKPLSEKTSMSNGAENFIEDYFMANVSQTGVSETIQKCVSCYCLLHEESGCSEREVVVIASSEHKFYVLLMANICNGSGASLKLIGCHMIDHIKGVLVGLGLHVIRVCLESNATYLFITRNIEKSRELLSILDSGVQSLEQVQTYLFQRHICQGLKISIFQYSMVQFWCDKLKNCTWLPRSLFVLQRHLLVCNEDLTQLGSLSENASSSYFSLDFCCAIVDVSEMVIETTESHCVTLTVEGANSEFCPSEKKDKIHEAVPKGDWKIKWFSEESLFKFVVLLKAIRTEASTSPLLVSYGQSFQV
nr:uncharacterized protein LOC109190201 isoform X1 [Ipomoea trifida]